LYDIGWAGADLRRRVLSWYSRHGRDLPWRKSVDPYRILVSEVMLQQTQVSRVLAAYPRFLRRFPSLRTLARASLGDVIREWSGLGYNRRARDLHRAARLAGRALPRSAAELGTLPGIGPYTASAVACFAHGQPIPFADTNIRRVLGRALVGRTATDREAIDLDRALVPLRSAAKWHHALMDLGATICVARHPRCAACPLRARCAYRGAEESPRRKQTEFASSDRRVRGAIIRRLALVKGPIAVGALQRGLGDARVMRLVGALEREGLVEVSEKGVRLPAR
jgi:A/G-specific adenine glycosylase